MEKRKGKVCKGEGGAFGAGGEDISALTAVWVSEGPRMKVWSP